MIYKRLFFLIFIILLSPAVSMGQKQANNWLFGNKAGVNFNGGTTAVTTGELVTQEGCSGYSDPKTGQLLFYTDGDSIWDKNNVVMPNGFGLGGHNSSTQSALVVPKPGSTTQFYVFTTGAWGGMQPLFSQGSFNVNVVDMTLNGGLGDVVLKNQLILSPVCEKLTATLHCNGVDYWVVVQKWNSNQFYSYLITASGISATPVISSIGYTTSSLLSLDGFKAIGYMKISPNGKKMALTYFTDSSLVEIFDFDNNTGVISNKISDNSWPPYQANAGLYGVSFSPDNSKLYISSSDGGMLGSSVFQYDLNAGSSAAIIASKTIINTVVGVYFGSLQLAPNGKIYLAKYNSVTLDEISNPNGLGTACNYISDNLLIGSGNHTSVFGLPNFVEIFNTPTQFKLTYDGCGGTYTTTILDTIIPFPITVTWDFGDPGSGVNNTSNLFQPTHSFSTIGTYNVSLAVTAGCINFVYTKTVDLTDSFFVDYGNDTTVCTGNSIQLTNLCQNGLNYVWTPTTGLSCSNCSSPIAQPPVTTTYIVSIDDGPGCHDEDTIVVNVLSGVTAIAIPDTAICAGQSVQLQASGGTIYTWFNDPALSAFNIPDPIATPMQSSNYTVIVSLPGCSSDTATVTVNILPPPTIDAGPDLSIINGNSVLINAISNGSTFLWQPGSSLSDSTILQPIAFPNETTTYIVTTDNGSGCIAYDTLIITVTEGTGPSLYFPNAFSPNEDGLNDLFDYFNFGFNKVWLRIYNRWGQLVYETDLFHDGWNGKFNDLDCSMGVYVYSAVATDNGKEYFFKGNFTLIR